MQLYEGKITVNFDYELQDGVLLAYTGEDTFAFVPEGVWKIGDGCFSDKTVDSVILPSSITEIAPHAFDSCRALSSIVIPANVERIGAYAFANCTALKSVYLEEGATGLEEGVFEGCHALREISVPSSAGHVGPWLGGCTGLRQANLDSRLTYDADDFGGSGLRVKRFSAPEGEPVKWYWFGGQSAKQKIRVRLTDLEA